LLAEKIAARRQPDSKKLVDRNHKNRCVNVSGA
jgi:hypothetical protein